MDGEFDEGEYRVTFQEYEGSDEHLFGCIEERWTKDQILHRNGGPALTMRDSQGNIVLKEFYRHNELHRLDGPARTKLYGDYKLEAWFVDGDQHRTGAPYEIEIFLPSGLITKEKWAEHGVLARLGGPAMVSRDPQTGIITAEYWMINGLNERLDGPAVTLRSSTGIAEEERYYLQGQLSRTDGPAIINRHPLTGNLQSIEYYKDGVQFVP